MLLFTQPTSYSYKVKIINPTKKGDIIVRELHHFTSEFESVSAIKMKLIDEFKGQVPGNIDFNIGYYDGAQHSKVWLVSVDDLKSMYSKHPSGGEIVLWCDGRSDVVNNENANFNYSR